MPNGSYSQRRHRTPSHTVSLLPGDLTGLDYRWLNLSNSSWRLRIDIHLLEFDVHVFGDFLQLLQLLAASFQINRSFIAFQDVLLQFALTLAKLLRSCGDE